MISQRFTENVIKIIKHDGMRIGEFESSLGYSAGYLSRISKHEDRYISLDIAYNIAEQLGYSVNEILNTDWNEIFEEEDRQAEIEILELQQKEIAERLASLRS